MPAAWILSAISNGNTAKPMGDLFLAVEIGGTKQQIALGTADGRILCREAMRLGKTDARAILGWLEARIPVLIGDRAVKGAAVGFGGPLESATGEVLMSLQVAGWKGFRLRDWFAQRFSMPVVIANDTFVGGLGELAAGAGRGADVLLYTNIGTGIGGGLYIHGEGFDGTGFGACYLGNTLVPDPDSPGSAVRMERVCAGPAIAARLNRPGSVPECSILVRCRHPLTARELGEAAAAGDAFGLRVVDEIAASFSIALANALAITGAGRIVIGGGVAKMGETLLGRIRVHTDRLAFVANRGRYTIVPSALMDDAVLAGALALASGKGAAAFRGQLEAQ